MKRILCTALCLVLILSTASAIEVTTNPLNDDFNNFFDSRRNLIKNEKYPGLFYALSIWSGLNPSTVSHPKLSIVDETVGHYLNVQYVFDDTIDPFVFSVARPKGVRYHFVYSKSFDTREISAAHFYRFTQTLMSSYLDSEDVWPILVNSVTENEQGGVLHTYSDPSKYTTIEYLVTPLDEGGYLHSISFGL